MARKHRCCEIFLCHILAHLLEAFPLCLKFVIMGEFRTELLEIYESLFAYSNTGRGGLMTGLRSKKLRGNSGPRASSPCAPRPNQDFNPEG